MDGRWNISDYLLPLEGERAGEGPLHESFAYILVALVYIQMLPGALGRRGFARGA